MEQIYKVGRYIWPCNWDTNGVGGLHVFRQTGRRTIKYRAV